VPEEVRAAGGALNSQLFRRILASVLAQPLRLSGQLEASAAGAAMVAAVALKEYDSIQSACRDWISPRLGAFCEPDPALVPVYAKAYPVYRKAYESLRDVWPDIAQLRE
jgi:erythritol kinase